MDAVSYANSAKQAQRIKKFINEPDSTSGVVTVPKVIASGETITIPAGRVAILPNVQIDGVLNVEGEVFIPSGSTLSTVVEKVTSTDNAIVRFDGTTGEVQNSSILIDDNGNLNITGTGKRITGDFSNATASNRLAFQTSTTNGNTSLGIIPNGTSTTSLVRVTNSSDFINYNAVDIVSSGSSTRVQTAGMGTALHTPLEFWVAGSEKIRIDTAGNVGIGTGSNINAKLDVTGSIRQYNPGVASNSVINMVNDGKNWYAGLRGDSSNSYTIADETRHRLILDAVGNTLHISPNGGLGYGTGSGGTVTQLTSKSTAVTLNKPTGQITMANTALIQNVKVSFLLYNSLIASTDNIILSVVSGSTVLAQYEARGRCSNGVAEIVVSHTYSSSLSDSVMLKFDIIKGANS